METEVYYNEYTLIIVIALFFPTCTQKIRGEYDTKKYDLKEEKKRTNKN